MNICRVECRFFSTTKIKLAKAKTPRIIKTDFRKKINTAVYGCGLSASGALSVPKLVVNNRFVTSKEVANPIRISQLNTWDIKHAAAGFGFSLFASSSKLYGAGINNRYQLTTKKSQEKSLTDYYISSKQLRLPNNPKILSISCGRAHSLIATSSGVYAFGENCHGQCGQDPDSTREVFGHGDCELSLVEIPTDSPVKSVHCSLDTSFVLTEAGEIFAFGLNEDGQCANGSTGIQWKPGKITGDAANVNITAISGTSDTPIAISTEGEIFLWGQCEYGQALLPNVDIFAKHSVHVPFPKRIISAASASSTVLVCTEDGEVFVWGVGLLGMGPELQRQQKPLYMDSPLFDNEKVTKVAAGITSFGAITEKGRAYTWGQNSFQRITESSMSFIERAAGLVVYRKMEGIIEYLLLQASYKPFHWTPPKGHVDPGEDEWTAALRETEEEAGIKKEQLIIHEDCHETMSYNVPKRGDPSQMVPKTVKYWLAGVKDKNEVLLSHEHQNMKWSRLEEAIEVVKFPEMGNLLRKFDAYLQKK